MRKTDTVSVKQAAGLLGCSPSAVLRLYHQAILAGYAVGRVGSKRPTVRIYRDSVAAYQTASAAPARPVAPPPPPQAPKTTGGKPKRPKGQQTASRPDDYSFFPPC